MQTSEIIPPIPPEKAFRHNASIATGGVTRTPLYLPLRDREWDFRGSDTQYSTNGLHAYLAAMIPELAAKLINTYVPRKGGVLDPYCGGGAVVVEAVLK